MMKKVVEVTIFAYHWIQYMVQRRQQLMLTELEYMVLNYIVLHFLLLALYPLPAMILHVSYAEHLHAPLYS